MQPEEIIQKKEWQQLTVAEKELLHSLAATESEYNLLKKILFIAREEISETPALDPAIKKNILAARKGRIRSMWYWAAAAIIIVLVAGWFIIQNGKGKEITVKVEKKAEPANKKNFKA